MTKKDVGLNFLVFGHQPSWTQIKDRMKTKMYDLMGAGGSKDIYIRIERVLELSQTVLVYFMVGMMLGVMLDRVFPKFHPEESHAKLWTMALLQIFLNAMIIYFMEKLINLVPFLFHFYDKYTPGEDRHGEIGKSIAMSLVFFATQDNLLSRVNEIQNRFNKDIYPKKKKKKKT